MMETSLKVQKMRYQSNSLSYILGFIGIGFSVAAAFIALNSSSPRFATAIMIIGNIIILLFGFLSCEKVKAYQKKYAYCLIAFGGICVARIFWVPMQLITYYAKWQTAIENGDSVTKLECEKILGATITKVTENGSYVAFLPTSGTFRGVLAIILLICAATAFIASGVICIIKSNKLNKYLATLEEKH